LGHGSTYQPPERVDPRADKKGPTGLAERSVLAVAFGIGVAAVAFVFDKSQSINETEFSFTIYAS